LADVINAVYKSLRGLEGQVSDMPSEPLKPAVPIRKSITPEYLICLEDGKRLKMLKRHLRSTYGLTPDEYRSKWGLSQTIDGGAQNMPSSVRNLPRRLVSGCAPAGIPRAGPKNSICLPLRGKERKGAPRRPFFFPGSKSRARIADGRHRVI